MKTIKVLGVHYRNSKNIGDRNCHPLDYIEFESDEAQFEIVKCDVRAIPDNCDGVDIVVFGGGAIANHGPALLSRFPDALMIAWGIGYTTGVKDNMKLGAHEKYLKGFSLYGSRDFGVSSTYVPCSSCLSSLFDNVPAPVRDVVLYGHAGKWPLREEAENYGFRYMDNTQHKFGLRGVIEHLSSGETIITSSYHGAYWASLLGRKVCMLPFGSKFYNLKNRPPISASVEEALKRADYLPGNTLKDYREETNSFQVKLIELIKTRFCLSNVSIIKKAVEDIM